VGHFLVLTFKTFWTRCRNLSPYSAKSLLGCSHMTQHYKFEEKKNRLCLGGGNGGEDFYLEFLKWDIL